MVEELFPPSERAAAPASSLVDSSLDRLVLAMSRDLVDDFPASDPRWMESVPASEADGGAAEGHSSSVGATM